MKSDEPTLIVIHYHYNCKFIFFKFKDHFK